MNTTCKHPICPATTSDSALCDCTIKRMSRSPTCSTVKLLEKLDARLNDAMEKSRRAKTGYIESNQEGRIRELNWLYGELTK